MGGVTLVIDFPLEYEFIFIFPSYFSKERASILFTHFFGHFKYKISDF